MSNLALLLYVDTCTLRLDLLWSWNEYSSVAWFAEGAYSHEGFVAVLEFLVAALYCPF